MPGDRVPFRLGPQAVEKAEILKARGAGKIPVLGPLMDPRARKLIPQEEVLLVNKIQKFRWDNTVSLWLENQLEKPNPFPVITEGDPADIGKVRLADGTTGGMSDVFEIEMANPGSMPMTTEQRAVVQFAKRLNEDINDWGRAEKVKFLIDENGNERKLDAGYFPRPVIGARRGKPGERTKFQKLLDKFWGPQPVSRLFKGGS